MLHSEFSLGKKAIVKRCSLFKADVGTSEERTTDDPLAFLYLSQCLGGLGEYQLASEVAEALQGISSDPEEIQHAQYLQATFSQPDVVNLEAIEGGD